MAGVGLHISQALKGRAKKSLEFTQLVKAIGAAAALDSAGGAARRQRMRSPRQRRRRLPSAGH
jgi:hypothetical protein